MEVWKEGEPVTEDIVKENEEKKKYLKSYKQKKIAVKAIEEQIEEICLAEINPSIKYTNMPTAHNARDLSDYAVKLEELHKKLDEARYNRVVLCSNIIKKIEAVEDEAEQNVLRYRYIACRKWEDICVIMGYEWAQIHRVHSRALRNFKR